MKYVVNRWTTFDKKTGIYSNNPWYMGKNLWGGKVVSDLVLRGGNVPSYLGIAFRRWDMRASVMYPKPLHLVFRFLNWLDYWTILPVGKGTWE